MKLTILYLADTKALTAIKSSSRKALSNNTLHNIAKSPTYSNCRFSIVCRSGVILLYITYFQLTPKCDRRPKIKYSIDGDLLAVVNQKKDPAGNPAGSL
jgi:hypothetical protein